MNAPQIIPRFEFRAFGLNAEKYENRMKELSPLEKTRHISSIYLLTAGKEKNNIKIRDGIMDIKVLEQMEFGLEQWNPFLVGEFPLSKEILRTVVFPAFGVESPYFDREEYSLSQFLEEIVKVDPDLKVAFVNKTRYAHTINACISEIAHITVNGAFIRTICVEDEDPEKVLEAKKMLGIPAECENVNYPLALKRIMGLAPLPENWK